MPGARRPPKPITFTTSRKAGTRVAPKKTTKKAKPYAAVPLHEKAAPKGPSTPGFKYKTRGIGSGGGISVRRQRRQTVGKFRLKKPQWIDPYPQIPGTEPEKRIFAALIQKGIYFRYHGGSPKEANAITVGEPDHDIDFLLPEYRVIIDPYSPYFHSLLPTATRDARKAEIFAAAGYTTYHPWAFAGGLWSWDEHPLRIGYTYKKRHYNRDRYPEFHKKDRGLHGNVLGTFQMLSQIPELNAGPRFKLDEQMDIKAKATVGYLIGSHLGAGATSVGAANHKRAHPKSRSFTFGTRRAVRRAR